MSAEIVCWEVVLDIICLGLILGIVGIAGLILDISHIGHISSTFIHRVSSEMVCWLSDDRGSGSRSNIGYWPHVTKIATPIPLPLLMWN